MTITTLNGVISGIQQAQVYTKGTFSASGTTVASPRFFTDWYIGGTPEASVATTVGINGEAVTPALASVGGRIRRTDPLSGSAYIAKFSMRRGASASGNFGGGAVWIVDRLWQNSGLSVTSTTTQTITPAALPPRDLNGTSNGEGVWCGLEWPIIAGAGTPNITLSYTNSAGISGNTTSTLGVSASAAGSIELFSLAAGHTGFRSIESFTMDATRTSGSCNLILFRPLVMIPIDSTNIYSINDAINIAMPKLYPNTVLQVMYISTTAVSGGFSAQYLETQG